MHVINWFEIPVSDFNRAVEFYESVMQVELRQEKMGDVEMAVFPHEDNAPGGAVVNFPGVKPSAQGCIIYLATPDLNGTLERIDTANGECVFGPMELPKGLGTIALFIDSEGNRIGLHQPPA